MDQEQGSGLYYPDGSFKSDKQIRYEHIDEPTIIRHELNGRKPNFYEMTDELIRRRDLREEFEAVPSEIDVSFETNEALIFCLLGDIHGMGYQVDYELLKHDVAFVGAHDNAFILGGGDWIEGAFFNPAQDETLAGFNAQRQYAISLVEELGEDKFAAMVMGDHDGWAERTWATLYDEIRDRTNIPIGRGSTRFNFYLPDAHYKLVGAHRLPGHSMYNKTHPENRESKFGTQAADIYVGWHTHEKAKAEQVADVFDEEMRQIFISGGPYKYSDKYSKKLGFSEQRAKKLGAMWLVLSPYRKNAQAFYTAEEALRYA
jgi:hypothetical protein